MYYQNVFNQFRIDYMYSLYTLPYGAFKPSNQHIYTA